jgi:hypothetical protein
MNTTTYQAFPVVSLFSIQTRGDKPIPMTGFYEVFINITRGIGNNEAVESSIMMEPCKDTIARNKDDPRF